MSANPEPFGENVTLTDIFTSDTWGIGGIEILTVRNNSFSETVNIV